MKVFVFDYKGTLTTLKAPGEFLRVLHLQEPDAKIVLYTGCNPGDVSESVTPWLHRVFIKGRALLTDQLMDTGWPIDEVIFVDDDRETRTSIRAFSSLLPEVSFTILQPKDLPDLLSKDVNYVD